MSALLEVCIESVADACAAQTGGADRVELCSALALGGLTPTRGLLREVLAATALPVVVMLRPRRGGCAYSADEFRVLRRDLDDLLAEEVAGIAVGVLRPDGRIDTERLAALVEQAAPTPLVFHRAFDLTPDPFTALEELIASGVRRVLTSGQEETAYQGSVLLRQLVERGGVHIEILPGGGINRFTVVDVVTRTGCRQVHASLRGSRIDLSAQARPGIRFGAATLPAESQVDGTDATRVSELVAMLRALPGHADQRSADTPRIREATGTAPSA